MPILGIVASSRPAIAAAADTGAMFPLQVVTVGAAGASDITFTNIPSTYSHLQIRGIARSSFATINGGFAIRLNSDTGNNYTVHILYGNGASAAAAAVTSDTSSSVAEIAGANASSNIFSASVIDILDYTNTNKYKTIRSLSGVDTNGSGQLRFGSGLWQNTNAVTSVTLLDYNGGTLQQYSQFALYGIKGAA